MHGIASAGSVLSHLTFSSFSKYFLLAQASRECERNTMPYKTEDGNEATPEDLGDEIDQFLSETNQLYVFDAGGSKFMVSAKVTFVPAED